MKTKLLLLTLLLGFIAFQSCKEDDENKKIDESISIKSFKLGKEQFELTIPAVGGITTIANAPRSIQTANAAGTLTAVVEVAAGATISPDPTTAHGGYESGKTFTVTSEDGKVIQMFTFTMTAYNATDNPYGVYTPAHLSDVNNGLGDSYKMMNHISLPQVSDEAATELGITDFAREGWKPIGDLSSTFKGMFDGNNVVVKNLYINRIGIDNVGLFGYTDTGSTIKNLGVELATGKILGRNSFGGVVGYNKGNVSNCYISGSLNGNNTVGGLIGYNDGGNVTNSYASVEVEGTINLGGLIGDSRGGNVSNCYTSGSVKGNSYVGGMFGYFASGTVNNSYSNGSVKGTIKQVGGLAAQIGLNGIVSNSYAIGTISVVPSTTNVGGLLASSIGTITNCYWDSESTGQAISAGGTGAVSKTTNDMKTQDFVNLLNSTQNPQPWKSGGLGNYPKLSWQN